MEGLSSQKPIFLDKNLHIIFSITLMAILGVSSLTPAFPMIGREFGITPREVGLLITVFTFPGIFLTPVLGVIADRYGRKKVLIPSLILFGIAGTACFFSTDFNMLVLFRFFQGVGASSLGALNVTLIGDIYKGKDRASAMGYNASVISIGTAGFPIIGGALAGIAWYYPFLMPLMAFPIAIFVLFLKNPEPERKQSLRNYFSAAFKSLREKRILGLLLISLVTFVILYGPILTYVPFLVSKTFKEGPFMIGIILASSSVATMVSSSQLGRLTARFSGRKLIMASGSLFFLSMALFPNMGSTILLILPALLFGTAMGINFPSVQTLLATFAPEQQRGAIMSANGMVLRLGQTLGPVVIAPVYIAWGLEGVYYMGSIISIFLLLSALFFIREKSN